MANTSDISRGMIINLDGSLYNVVEFGENKTARAAAKVWAKLKGVDNNRSIEKTWNSGDTIFPVRVEKRYYQFLYKDDTGYNFMDNETFEQPAIKGDVLGEKAPFLKEGMEVKLTFYNGAPLDVEIPSSVDLKVVEAETAIRGDTATGVTKKVKTETGLEVSCPQFVKVGDTIRVNTETGDYVTRV